MGIIGLSLVTDILFQPENGKSYKWGVSYVSLGVGIGAPACGLAVMAFGRCLTATGQEALAAEPRAVLEEGRP